MRCGLLDKSFCEVFFHVHGLLWCTAFPSFRAYLSVKQELFIFPWPVSCPSEGSQKVNSKLALNYNQDSIWCGDWLRTVSDCRRLEKIALIVQWKAATQAELIWYSEKNLTILFNKFFPKSELMKGKGTYLSLSNLRQHKWNYMISKGLLWGHGITFDKSQNVHCWLGKVWVANLHY